MRLRILLALAGLIAYGSLYPFHFALPLAHAAAWANLFGDWSPLTSRADALGNLALFLPFGFAGAYAAGRQTGLASRIAALALAGLALALVLQFAQIYVPERTASLGDVIWNAFGLAAGIAAGMLLPAGARIPSLPLRAGAWPLGLIALWLVAELLPFVPSLDVESVKSSLKALLRPTLEPGELLFHAAGTLIAGCAMAAVAGEAFSLLWLPLLAIAVAAGKVFIVTRTLDISTLCGLALGCAGWWMLARQRGSRRGMALVLALLAAYAIGALMPFELRDSPQPFNLLPLAGLLRGSMLVNSQALAASLCLYAGILGVMRMNGASPVASSVALAILVGLFEVVQMFLEDRSPDITEPLLVLLVGQVLRFAPVPGSEPTPAPAPVPRSTQMSATAPPQRPVVVAPSPATRAHLAAWGASLAVVCVAMAFAFAAVLRLPKVPYNVAELFLRHGAFPFLMIFAFSLLWIGGGARLVGYFAASSARPWLAMPWLAFAAGVVSLLLMGASVTQESIGDISGSNNLHWFVINKGIWGAWAGRLFLVIPEGVVSFFERPVRYAALFGPLITFLALMFAGVDWRARFGRRSAAALAISAGLWLWLCKGIAFDWSSTDNLNELIARDGPWGWGGGGYLYALLAAVCANAVLLARMPPKIAWIAVGACVTAGMIPVGWWLLNLGLEPEVHKYGFVFPGAQFLLGPDREHVLSPDVLFLRWSVVQFAGVLVLAAGGRLAQPVIAWLAQRNALPAAA